MKNTVQFDYSHATSFISLEELYKLSSKITSIHDEMNSKKGTSGEMLGWIDWPKECSYDLLCQIEDTACAIKKKSDVFLVIGIGGSYLGARAVIEMLNHSFYNLLPDKRRKTPQIIFVGHTMHPHYIQDLFDVLRDREVSLNVISKSGTTTEPAIAFRIFRQWMEKKYGKEEARARIYVTTDEKEGALRKLSEQEGYQTFVIPRHIGGRFSVLTPVGLLPIAVSGINIMQMMKGAKEARQVLDRPSLFENSAYQYAAIRHLLYERGKVIECLIHYDPKLHYLTEWWKQLFGESEGKDQKGIFPVSLNYTTDLHSIGQYVQDGRRHLFQTILHVENIPSHLTVAEDKDNLDQLNYLTGKHLSEINEKSFEAALMAHSEGGVPNLIVHIPKISPFYVGYLIYFFEKACAMSGSLLGVNPFNQPGVEAYKQNMFALLGKPGYDHVRLSLESKSIRNEKV